MNNSKIVIDDMSLTLEMPIQNIEHLNKKQGELIQIIKAIEEIKTSEEWSSLKSLIFAGLVQNLENRLKFESEKIELDEAIIHQIQGQLLWARKYADLDKLAESYRIELSGIKKLLPSQEA